MKKVHHEKFRTTFYLLSDACQVIDCQDYLDSKYHFDILNLKMVIIKQLLSQALYNCLIVIRCLILWRIKYQMK